MKTNKPVSWQEALQAWANRQTVRCVLESGTTFLFDGTNFYTTSTKLTILSEEMINKGIWYIEEACK